MKVVPHHLFKWVGMHKHNWMGFCGREISGFLVVSLFRNPRNLVGSMFLAHATLIVVDVSNITPSLAVLYCPRDCCFHGLFENRHTEERKDINRFQYIPRNNVINELNMKPPLSSTSLSRYYLFDCSWLATISPFLLARIVIRLTPVVSERSLG